MQRERRSSVTTQSGTHIPVAAILARPEMKEQWAGNGVEYVSVSTEQFAVRLREDYERTGALLKAAGVKAE
jgi:tripartite-type tricarboxylate transporter receptor subunit TctC